MPGHQPEHALRLVGEQVALGQRGAEEEAEDPEERPGTRRAAPLRGVEAEHLLEVQRASTMSSPSTPPKRNGSENHIVRTVGIDLEDAVRLAEPEPAPPPRRCRHPVAPMATRSMPPLLRLAQPERQHADHDRHDGHEDERRCATRRPTTAARTRAGPSGPPKLSAICRPANTDGRAVHRRVVRQQALLHGVVHDEPEPEAGARQRRTARSWPPRRRVRLKNGRHEGAEGEVQRCGGRCGRTTSDTGRLRTMPATIDTDASDRDRRRGRGRRPPAPRGG